MRTTYTGEQIFEILAQGKTVQELTATDVWMDISPHKSWTDILHDGNVYSIKPETILINGLEVVKPICEAPPTGTPIFVSDLMNPQLFSSFTWGVAGVASQETQEFYLRRNICHLTKEDATQHSKVMLQIFSNVTTTNDVVSVDE